MNTLLFQQQIKRRKKKPGKRSRKRVFSLKLNPMIFTVYLPLSIAFGFFILFAGVYNSQLATDPVSETGSGVLPVSRENDIEYTIQKHDTIYQIAYTHGVDPMELAEYNNIANPSFIKPGQMILIPSTGHLDDRRVQVLTAAAGTDQSTPASTINATDNSRSIPKPVSSPSLLPAKILIGSEQQSDGLSVTAKFFLETKIDVKAGATYIWDFG
ncbi:MAG: LysM peptidoglycan-binding domain-containing protein, partial [Spirochaetaceae bacterium]